MKTRWMLAIACALTGCGATVPIPVAGLARAEQAIQSAEQSPGASAAPNAATFLTLAKNNMQHAKKSMAEARNEEARLALLRAEADAEVALALAQAEAARLDAEATVDAIRKAMTEMQKEGAGS